MTTTAVRTDHQTDTAPMDLGALASYDAPFAEETAELFAAVRDHDLPTLAARCDDDLGIVDINPSGGSEVIRYRAAWESWFVQLFAQLDAMDATTDTEIHRYAAVNWDQTGMSAVEFVQTLTVGGLTGRFRCIVTIVWKRQTNRWVEARWHRKLPRDRHRRTDLVPRGGLAGRRSCAQSR